VSRSNVMEVGNPCGAECLRYSSQSGLRTKIGAHMVSHQHRGALINDIERLDHMLLFAMGISRNARGIFKVELPGLASARAAPGVHSAWGGERQCVRFPARADELCGSILATAAAFLLGFHPDSNNRGWGCRPGVRPSPSGGSSRISKSRSMTTASSF
jgi:hypothetical protein